MAERKIRVLQINKMYYPEIGGIEGIVRQVAEGLRVRTEMKVLVCNRKGGNTAEFVNGVRVFRNKSIGSIGNIPLPVGFVSMINRFSRRTDIVLAHLPYPISDISCLLSRYKGKIVIWWHSDVARQKKLMTFYKPIMKAFLKRADAIIVGTEGHVPGSHYLKPYADKCHVIPYGVKIPVEKDADAYIKKVESGEIQPKDANERVRFLFVGRIVYYKGVDVLLRAFQSVTNAELVLAGSGNMTAEMQALTDELGLKDRVTFLGAVSDEQLRSEYAKCDVFVLPSVVRSEAFGIVQIEAMAYGKPVINTRLPSGAPFVSLDGVSGLTVPPGDVEALAVAMQRMVDEPEQRRIWGANARKRMKEEFTEKIMLDRLMRLFEDLTRKENG